MALNISQEKQVQRERKGLSDENLPKREKAFPEYRETFPQTSLDRREV